MDQTNPLKRQLRIGALRENDVRRTVNDHQVSDVLRLIFDRKEVCSDHGTHSPLRLPST